LTEEERAALEKHRDHHRRPQQRERCAALLKVAAGKAPYWVARHGLLKPRCPNTLYAWVKGYQTQGADGLLAYCHGGARRRRL
jgi:hypothetical protein